MMTRQEIFTKVATHLFTQNAKAEENGRCQYLTADGKKCAIGCLIPADKYNAVFEGTTPMEKSRVYNAECAMLRQILEEVGVNDEDMSFLRILQRQHDFWAPSEWRERLTKIAAEFGLTMPEVAQVRTFDAAKSEVYQLLGRQMTSDGPSCEELLTDALVDLMHWAHAAQENFQECAERAYAHFEAESPKPEDGNL
jgi:hypothetical protein